MEREGFTRHISGALNQSLESIFDHILNMGDMVEKQVSNTVEALQKNSVEIALDVLIRDKKINTCEIKIDSLCASVLARQQPTALDLRLVLSATRMAVDMERIGDEIVKIAKLVVIMDKSNNTYLDSSGIDDLIKITLRSSKMLHVALNGFARLSADVAKFIIQEEEAIDTVYKKSQRDLTDKVKQGGDQAAFSLELIIALRAAERMSDHARNIGESIIYLVSGQDIRGMERDDLQIFLDKIEK